MIHNKSCKTNWELYYRWTPLNKENRRNIQMGQLEGRGLWLERIGACDQPRPKASEWKPWITKHSLMHKHRNQIQSGHKEKLMENNRFQGRKLCSERKRRHFLFHVMFRLEYLPLDVVRFTGLCSTNYTTQVNKITLTSIPTIYMTINWIYKLEPVYPN